MRVYPTLDAWLRILAVVGASVLVITIVCALVAAGLAPWEGRTRRRREPRHVLRTIRRFADLVAVGDLEAADAAASEAFCEASRPRIGWDERTILDLSLDKARQELTETALAATWFPDVRRVARGDVVEIVLGRREEVGNAAAHVSRSTSCGSVAYLLCARDGGGDPGRWVGRGPDRRPRCRLREPAASFDLAGSPLGYRSRPGPPVP